MSNVENRQEIERKVVRHLVRTMKAAGWDAFSVDDGGEIVKTRTEAEVMDTVFSVDESTIRFRKGSTVHVAVIVLGNDGWDCIADYSFSDDDTDGFDALMQQVSAYAEKLEMEA
jgi:hypothetical protein